MPTDKHGTDIPSPPGVRLSDKILTIVDDDIAALFKEFPPGGFVLHTPLLAQIARDLKKIVSKKD